jgi:heme exporter protein A
MNLDPEAQPRRQLQRLTRSVQAGTMGLCRLQGDALACERGQTHLFKDLCFRLEAGEWLNVRGANGAGKTSLLRQIAGLSPLASGVLRWNGVEIAKCHDQYRQALAYIGHLPGMKAELTALENIRVSASLEGQSLSEEHALDALDRMGLYGREDLPVRDLSQGQRRRVALSRLIWREARLWILDEPLTALDAPTVDLVTGMLEAHLRGGGMAVLTSHQHIALADAHVVNL